MGLVSPMASAKRRIAPFSTSLTAGFASRPVALRSTMMLPSPARRQIKNADQSRLGPGHQRRGVHHGPGRGAVALRAARDQHLDAGVSYQFDLVAWRRSAQRDGQVEVRDFLAVVEGARHLLDADDAALGHAEAVAL